MFSPAGRTSGGDGGCLVAARVLDQLLAVVVTRHDGEDDIDKFADTIRREVAQWPSS
jgi:hypothetical protein